jgi:hypothetical protein
MLKINTEATMHCPICGSKYKQKMPQIGRHINNKCVVCHTFFGIKNINDCCVYCSYSNVICPEAQKKTKKENE